MPSWRLAHYVTSLVLLRVPGRWLTNLPGAAQQATADRDTRRTNLKTLGLTFLVSGAKAGPGWAWLGRDRYVQLAGRLPATRKLNRKTQNQRSPEANLAHLHSDQSPEAVFVT